MQLSGPNICRIFFIIPFVLNFFLKNVHINKSLIKQKIKPDFRPLNFKISKYEISLFDFLEKFNFFLKNLMTYIDRFFFIIPFVFKFCLKMLHLFINLKKFKY